MIRLTTGDRAAAARQVIAAMVEPTIQVCVHIDRLLADDLRRLAGAIAARPVATLVLVEMVGPDGSIGRVDKNIVATAEAQAWCNDEIVSAARRAAEGIIRKNPTWRRDRAAMDAREQLS